MQDTPQRNLLQASPEYNYVLLLVKLMVLPLFVILYVHNHHLVGSVQRSAFEMSNPPPRPHPDQTAGQIPLYFVTDF